jgi:preprotein translocase subunit SecA
MGERIDNDVANMISDTSKNIVEMYEDDYENMKLELLRVMALEIPFKEEDMKKMRTAEMERRICMGLQKL